MAARCRHLLAAARGGRLAKLAERAGLGCCVAGVSTRAAATAEAVAIGEGRVAVVGSVCHGSGQAVYVLSHGGSAAPSWMRNAAPPEFAGHASVVRTDGGRVGKQPSRR
ncbi:unnamed protein product [Urochloa humidicola]